MVNNIETVVKIKVVIKYNNQDNNRCKYKILNGIDVRIKIN